MNVSKTWNIGAMILLIVFGTLLPTVISQYLGNCTKESRLQCNLYGTKSCHSSMGAYSKNNDAKWPGAPTDFQAVVFTRKDPKSKGQVLGAHLTWKADPTGSVNYLKGFEVSVYLTSGVNSGGKNICRVLDYSEVKENRQWKMADLAKIFRVDIHPLPADASFYAEIYALPKPPSIYESMSTLYFTTPQDKGQEISSTWTTAITTTYNRKGHRALEIKFEPAPLKFNFPEYEVALYASYNNIYLKKKSVYQNENTVIFDNICPGIYDVWVYPVDKYFGKPNKCLCKDAASMCQTCVISTTGNLRYKGPPCASQNTSTAPVLSLASQSLGSETFLNMPAVPIDLKSKNDNNNNNLVISVSVIGTLMGIGLLLVIFTQRKFFGAVQNKMTAGDSLLSLKQVLILCTNDHAAHDKAIDSLIIYLKKFQCLPKRASILTKGDEKNDQERIKWQIQQTDIVLLVNSTGLGRRQEAWANGLDYMEFWKEPDSSLLSQSLFSFIDKMHRSGVTGNKFFSCKLNHASNSCIFKHYPSNNVCYSIAKNFTEIIRSIHNLSLDYTIGKEFSIPLNDEHSTPEGKAFLEAIDEALKFESNNPKWFEEKYGYPIPNRQLSPTSDCFHNTKISSFVISHPYLETSVSYPDYPWFKTDDNDSVLCYQYPVFCPEDVVSKSAFSVSPSELMARINQQSDLKEDFSQKLKLTTDKLDQCKPDVCQFIDPDNQSLGALSV